MKKQNLARIAGAIAIPALATMSGCATLKGVTHDIGYISTNISDSIDLKEKSEVVSNPSSYRFQRK